MPEPKTTEIVSAERVALHLRSRFNPIRNLTPATLAYQLDRFHSGYIRDAAITWDKIETRDDVLSSVIPKRRKSVSRHGWEIVMADDSPEAARQKEALEFFFAELTATSAVDLNYTGGLQLLVRQMMDAVGKRYAVHEIVWQPTPNGLTATFRFVPVWFFENTAGKLRYRQSEGAISGIPLEPGEWMVTAGDGLMEPCSVAYMFKRMPLNDWLIYSERHGMPGLHGVTDAAEGSTEWNTLVTALQNFGVDWAMVTNRGAEINKVDTSATGELPYPKLVERMDRAMAALWRGADLSTMSAGSGEGTGASLQGEESDILEDDDADLISETLNRQVVPWVLRYALGDVAPLAEIRINTGQKQDVKLDLEVDRFLINAGAPVAVNDLLERYGRPQPNPDEQLAVRAPGPLAIGNSADRREPANVSGAQRRQVAIALAGNAMDQLAQAQAAVLKPLRDQLEYILGIEDPAFQRAALRNLQNELPRMLVEMNADPETAAVIENAMAAALVNGWAEGAVDRPVQEVAA